MSSKNNSPFAPTLTLAKLYESQNQLIDSLIVTDKLLKLRKDSSVFDFKKQIVSKILSAEEGNFSEKLLSLFSKEQIEKLLVFPDEKCDEYFSNIETDLEPEFPDELDIEEDDKSPIFIEETQKEEVLPNTETPQENLEEILPTNLMSFLNTLDQSLKLSELTIKDLKKIIISWNNEKKR